MCLDELRLRMATGIKESLARLVHTVGILKRRAEESSLNSPESVWSGYFVYFRLYLLFICLVLFMTCFAYTSCSWVRWILTTFAATWTSFDSLPLLITGRPPYHNRQGTIERDKAASIKLWLKKKKVIKVLHTLKDFIFLKRKRWCWAFFISLKRPHSLWLL